MEGFRDFDMNRVKLHFEAAAKQCETKATKGILHVVVNLNDLKEEQESI